uniref:Uncharacterized protein n=1 Tax=Cacopsylla melanoneura TaxID=428564 RepID=A0A8D8RLI4_9HEMI
MSVLMWDVFVVGFVYFHTFYPILQWLISIPIVSPCISVSSCILLPATECITILYSYFLINPPPLNQMANNFPHGAARPGPAFLYYTLLGGRRNVFRQMMFLLF